MKVFNSLLVNEITDCGSAVATYESVVFIVRGISEYSYQTNGHISTYHIYEWKYNFSGYNWTNFLTNAIDVDSSRNNGNNNNLNHRR